MGYLSGWAAHFGGGGIGNAISVAIFQQPEGTQRTYPSPWRSSVDPAKRYGSGRLLVW